MEGAVARIVWWLDGRRVMAVGLIITCGSTAGSWAESLILA